VKIVSFVDKDNLVISLSSCDFSHVIFHIAVCEGRHKLFVPSLTSGRLAILNIAAVASLACRCLLGLQQDQGTVGLSGGSHFRLTERYFPLGRDFLKMLAESPKDRSGKNRRLVGHMGIRPQHDVRGLPHELSSAERPYRLIAEHGGAENGAQGDVIRFARIGQDAMNLL
jgi:hypothetical protein